MWQKISVLPTMAYMAFIEFVEDFKKDENGLEVVQVVLIILVGVVLVGALMFLLREWLAELWETITGVNVESGSGSGF